MKLLIAGVKCIAGTSDKTGRSYSFSEVYGLLPLESVDKQNLRVETYGFEPVTFKLADGLIREFAGLRFPGVFDVEQVNRKFRDTVEIFISGINRPEIKPA